MHLFLDNLIFSFVFLLLYENNKSLLSTFILPGLNHFIHHTPQFDKRKAPTNQQGPLKEENAKEPSGSPGIEPEPRARPCPSAIEGIIHTLPGHPRYAPVLIPVRGAL